MEVEIIKITQNKETVNVRGRVKERPEIESGFSTSVKSFNEMSKENILDTLTEVLEREQKHIDEELIIDQNKINELLNN